MAVPADRGFGPANWVGGITFGVGNKLAAGILSPLLDCALQETRFAVNAAARTHLPSIDALFGLHYSGLLPRNQLQGLAGLHGVNLSPFDGLSATRAYAWRQILDNGRPHYPLESIRKWTRQGRLTSAAELTVALRQEGFYRPDESALFVNDYENLSPGNIVTLWLMSFIDDIEARRLLAIVGYRRDEADKLLATAQERPPIASTLGYLNRGQIDSAIASKYIRSHGIVDGTDIAKVLTERFASPSPASVVDVAGRGLWDDKLSDLWQLDESQPNEYKAWCERVGLNFSAETDAYGSTSHTSRHWSDILWRGHWQLPSWQVLSQIIHRFRGDPNDPSTWSQPGYPPLGEPDIIRTMRAMGLPSTLRGYMGRLVYSPISVRHIRLVAQYQNPPFDWIVGAYQDNGYSPVDARMLASALAKDIAVKQGHDLVALQKQTWRKLVNEIESAYEVGSLGNAQAVNALTSQGIPAGDATTMLATVDMKVAAGIVRKVVIRARSDVFSGRTTWAGAEARLLKAGMDANRAAQTVSGWVAEYGEGRRTLATDKILSLLRKGFISTAEALSRLNNIGWSNADQLLLLRDVSAEMAKDHASLVRAREASSAKEEREAERLIRKTASQAHALMGRLKVLTPPKDVVKWYVDGIWSEAKARDRLRLLGFPDDIIDTMFVEAIDKAKTKKAKGTNGTANA